MLTHLVDIYQATAVGRFMLWDFVRMCQPPPMGIQCNIDCLTGAARLVVTFVSLLERICVSERASERLNKRGLCCTTSLCRTTCACKVDLKRAST